MAEDQSKSETSTEFKIGKSFGLSNSSNSIDIHRKKLSEIQAAVKLASDEELANMNKWSQEAIDEMEKATEKIFSVQEGILEKLAKLVHKIENHSTSIPPEKKEYQDMADEVLKQAVADFKENLKVLKIIGQPLADLVGEFRNRTIQSLADMEAERKKLFEKLGRSCTDFIEYERGYVYGEAIRFALSENKKG